MTEALNPYEVVQIAANDRRARFEVTITGYIEVFELDSEDGATITIADQKIKLHDARLRTTGGPVPNYAIKVRRVES